MTAGDGGAGDGGADGRRGANPVAAATTFAGEAAAAFFAVFLRLRDGRVLGRLRSPSRREDLDLARREDAARRACGVAAAVAAAARAAPAAACRSRAPLAQVVARALLIRYECGEMVRVGEGFR